MTTQARTTEQLAVSTTEAAHMLGRSSQHVRTLITQGKLRAVRQGRSLRVVVSDIRRLAGDEDVGHEAVSSRPSPGQREVVKELRRMYAEMGRLLAELDN